MEVENFQAENLQDDNLRVGYASYVITVYLGVDDKQFDDFD